MDWSPKGVQPTVCPPPLLWWLKFGPTRYGGGEYGGAGGMGGMYGGGGVRGVWRFTH